MIDNWASDSKMMSPVQDGGTRIRDILAWFSYSGRKWKSSLFMPLVDEQRPSGPDSLPEYNIHTLKELMWDGVRSLTKEEDVELLCCI